MSALLRLSKTDAERLRKAILRAAWSHPDFYPDAVCAAIVEEFGPPDEYGPDEAVMLKIAQAIYDLAKGAER